MSPYNDLRLPSGNGMSVHFFTALVLPDSVYCFVLPFANDYVALRER